MAERRGDIEIRRDSATAERTEVWRGESLVARFDIAGERVTVRAGRWCTRDDAEVILRLADELTDGRVTWLDVVDPLVRFHARRSGFAGGLRRPLSKAPLEAEGPGGGGEPATPSELLGAVQSLVPRASITARPARGVVRRATSGLPAMIDLTVEVHDGPRLTVSCPDRVDVVPETIALAIDTAAVIRSRFAVAGEAVQSILFDHSAGGFRRSKWAGMAHPNLAAIHLNASLAFAEGLDVLARQPSSSAPPAPTPPPATAVDGIVAHECWHQMEATLEVRRYRDTMAFRQRLGEHFGVATIEHAVLGGTSGAPAAWAEAHRRLTEEVSPYAGTSRREATAEMFALWWCGSPGGWSPAVAHFGEAVTAQLLEPRG
ncbi:MAG TPA: hypothetical protein VM030_09050 [Acidimicrobiales bacterium]|nr:hypothetical protein [Acidimicrobiales bacterium]